MLRYCKSRVQSIRRITREVMIGEVPIGAHHAIAVQSMTTTRTEDVAATVAQARSLIEAGCAIVRVTAPSLKAARALKEIRERLSADGFSSTPLVADIHFLPKAALEAVEHVEKVRINPGNFADHKQFKVLEYSDAAYQEELERLHEAFSPFVLRCKELGRAVRIGTNHGSLSDRIMNRYGDSPEGMVESALEFIRIAESLGFYNMVLSMKASNPKVMVAAYRLAVARMDQEGMAYPLHLGVTEAGDGEDARIKSSMGIGSLLADGLGDTIRVSLTEDPVHEIPVARELVRWAERMQQPRCKVAELNESVDWFHPARRSIIPISLGPDGSLDVMTPPLVAIGLPAEQPEVSAILPSITATQIRQKHARIEYWMEHVTQPSDIERLRLWMDCLPGVVKGMALDVSEPNLLDVISTCLVPELSWFVCLQATQAASVAQDSLFTEGRATLVLDLGGCEDLSGMVAQVKSGIHYPFMITLTRPLPGDHAIGSMRRVVAAFAEAGLHPAVWLRNVPAMFSTLEVRHFQELLLESSIYTGTLLCDGIGNMISVETEANVLKATSHAYNLLQGARVRQSKTEFVACPSCGRTLFDLQSTTQRIRARTDHLKGVTIAIMGCIVNGPGEMADADFGYVGGAPGKVNLYVGKTAIRHGIPEGEAVDALVALIREHGKWVEPELQPCA